jgi:hypothetical protein
LLNAHLDNPPAEEIEVTDPTHPLFGQRFVVHSLSQPPTRAGFVHVVYQETMILRIPLAATDRQPCLHRRTRTKWTAEAMAGVLTLLQEVQQSCPPDPSGGGSRPNSKHNAFTTSRPS